jgi:predicted transcriptional regulator
MKIQKITLSLPAELIHRIEHLADMRQTSISNLVSQALEELLAKEAYYDKACNKNMARLDMGIDLGTDGKIPWDRSDLHER